MINTYESFKKANPDLPIMIREAKGTPARAFARFGASSSLHLPSSKPVADAWLVVERGVEKNVSLEGLDEKSVGEKIGELVSASGTTA